MQLQGPMNIGNTILTKMIKVVVNNQYKILLKLEISFVNFSFYFRHLCFKMTVLFALLPLI